MKPIWKRVNTYLTENDIAEILRKATVDDIFSYDGFPGENLFRSFGMYSLFTSKSMDDHLHEIVQLYGIIDINDKIHAYGGGSNRKFFRFCFTSYDHVTSSHFDMGNPWLIVWYRNEESILLSTVVGLMKSQELLDVLRNDGNPTSDTIIPPLFHMSRFHNYFTIVSSSKFTLEDIRNDGGQWNRNISGIPSKRSRYKRIEIGQDLELQTIISNHPKLPLRRKIAWLINIKSGDFASNILCQYYNVMAPLPIHKEDFFEKKKTAQISKSVSSCIMQDLEKGLKPCVILQNMSDAGYNVNIKQIYNMKRSMKKIS